MAVRHKFRSLGRQESCTAESIEPDRYRHFLELSPGTPHIARGGGLSMVGASFGESVRVIGMHHFNRILAFDAERATLEAEAGVTLGQLFSFLTPRGFIVPVQPGYPGVTLGGSIAGNVHGKNQYREGVFADIVKGLRLYHPIHGEMDVSPGHNPDLFELTCGGFGLTGIILTATIEVRPLIGTSVEVSHLPVANLEAAAEMMLAERDDHEMLYSWHDGARYDKGLGRGFVVSGRIISGSDAKVHVPAYRPLDSDDRNYPVDLIDSPAISIFNRLYGGVKRNSTFVNGLFETLYPFAMQTTYFRSYGPKGFIEHQVLIPADRIAAHFGALVPLIRRYRQRFGMVSLKVYSGRRSLLRYSGEGICLGLHMPSSDKARRFLAELDAINTDNGAITNLIKDPRIDATVAEAQYPGIREFRRRLRTFDPERHFNSILSERLKL